MRLIRASALAIVVALVVPAAHGVAFQMDPDRVVPGGGIFASGWKGLIDAGSVKQGRNINDSKFEQQGNTITLTVGPAAVYWNPANTASGDYTVKASFREPKYMSANSHPPVFANRINTSRAPSTIERLTSRVQPRHGDVSATSSCRPSPSCRLCPPS